MYTFVFDKSINLWLYKASSSDEVLPFIEMVKDTRVSGALDLYWSLMKDNPNKDIRGILEDMPTGERHNLMITKATDFNIMLAIIMQAENYGGTFFDGIRHFNIEWGYAILERLKKDKAVYFNAQGGMISNPEVSAFFHNSSLVFPDWSERDIRVKQFEGGKHYYAYIGTIQVRDGDTLKWDTSQQAWEAAKRLL